MIKWSKFSGWYLVSTGIIHNFIGLIFGWPVLVGMHYDGWWNTIESASGVNFMRSAILWFLLLGFFWMLMGFLMQQWLNKAKQPLPTSIGYAFLLIGLATAIVIPASGAWLFIPQGLIIIADGVKTNSEPITA